MNIQTSWDDGNSKDMKIFDLLSNYNLKGIFFLSNYDIQLSRTDVEKIGERFEVGGHTVSHPQDMKRLSKEQLVDEIENNKKWLEDTVGKEIKWFCYPRGRYNEEVIDVVRESGYKYARTTLVGNTDYCQNHYRVHPSVHVYPFRKEYKTGWLDYAKEQFEIAKQKDGYFHIFGHSWEIEKYNLWDELESFFKYIYEYKNN